MPESGALTDVHLLAESGNPFVRDCGCVVRREPRLDAEFLHGHGVDRGASAPTSPVR